MITPAQSFAALGHHLDTFLKNSTFSLHAEAGYFIFFQCECTVCGINLAVNTTIQPHIYVCIHLLTIPEAVKYCNNEFGRKSFKK